MYLASGTTYPLRRHEIETCRVYARENGKPLTQVLGEWAFCMAAGLRVNQRQVVGTNGRKFGVVVTCHQSDHLLLPVSAVPAVDTLVLVSLHDARWPHLKFAHASADGTEFVGIMSPNDNDWVATIHGAVPRANFDSKAECLDGALLPLGKVCTPLQLKSAPAVAPKEFFRGVCAYKLWRRQQLRGLQ